MGFRYNGKLYVPVDEKNIKLFVGIIERDKPNKIAAKKGIIYMHNITPPNKEQICFILPQPIFIIGAINSNISRYVYSVGCVRVKVR
jgi:hypothetical protein